jgi:hypothetical protein
MAEDDLAAYLIDKAQRIVDLEAGLRFLTLRHSALEWIVEQTVANWLLPNPAEAEKFLTAISHDDDRTWRREPEYDARATPADAAALGEQVRAIAEKIRQRVREGARRG